MGPATDSDVGSTSETLRFPKLNGDNYHSWADNMKAALQAKSLWGVVSAREHCPPRPPLEFPKLRALHAITAVSPVAPVAESSKGESSKGVKKSEDEEMLDIFQSKEYRSWELATERYDKWLNKDDAAMGLMRNAIEYAQRESIINVSGSEAMWEHLQISYVHRQSGINVYYNYAQLFAHPWNGSTPMSDHLGFYYNIRRRFLGAGKHIEDETIINAIFVSLPTTPTWEVVKQSLLHQRTTLTLEEVTTELVSVYERTLHEKTAGGSKALALFSNGNNTSRKGKKKKQNKREPKPSDTCHNCGALGHWSPNCPEKKKSKNEKSSVKKDDTAHLTVDKLQPVKDREVGKLYMAVNTDSNIESKLILDCAATCHMFSKRELFDKYESTSGDFVSVGGQHKVPILGRGSVKFQSQISPHQISDVILNDVLHIPSLGANLVSLGTLHRDGASFISSEDSLTVFVNGDPLIRAELIGSTGTLYEIQDPNKTKPTAFITSANTMRLWHRRMGHFSPSSIRYMDSKNMVKGLKISKPGEYDRLCAGCAHGKSHRLPLPNASTSQYSKMELLVMDLTGPLPVPTWDGKLYALVIVDAKCRYPVGRLLKNKDEVGAMVRDVVSMLERQSGLKAKRFRSDNGTEFVNSVMNEFCQRNGIIHETTVPYTPEQNGIAERAIAVLFEMIRSMLHTTNLDLRYWGEAFMYAVHIRSLMLTSSLKEKVPYEAWTGRKPDVSHLRIFGSLGWAHVPKEVQHGKLESRAVRVRMLGWWTDEAKGYRLEDLENGKLIASRDVQFDENDSPSELASIDLDLPTSSSDAINDLVDSAVDQDDDDQEPINDELITPVIDPTPKIPPAPTKSKKWEDLPLREPSSCER
jgi:transposase InsO family protein